jgi:hypothetical protein
MSLNLKKSIGWCAVLMLLGVAALFAGANWLVLLIPAASLVWYGAMPSFRSGRH